MFELKISDLLEAQLLSQEWATHTISLRSPRFVAPDKKNGKSVQRYFYFDDVDPSQVSSDSFLKAATSRQIQAILKFTARLQSKDKLLVHCGAGVSRSPAVAMGILCQHGFMPNEAVRFVYSIRPQTLPNQHIIRLFDDILGLKGKLVAAAIIV